MNATKTDNTRKTEEKVVKKSYKFCFQTYPDGSSRFTRKDGFPSISDKTEASVAWVMAQGFKEEDIELIGEKPASWFPAPVVV